LRFAFAPFAAFFENKWFFDRLYEDLLVRRVFYGGVVRLCQLFDTYVIDGAVNGSGRLGAWASGELRAIQNGQVQAYQWSLAAGVIVIVVAVFAANPL
jgi:NADH-quinone oxidoreductase subunit L